MKVLHVIPSVAAAHGGPSRAMRMIEQALAARGIEVETATTDDDGTRGGRLDEARSGDAAGRRYFRKSSHFYKVSVQLARWLREHVRDYDLVHVHALFSFSSTAAVMAARRAGVPYVIRPLGTLADYGMRNRRRLLKGASLRLMEGRFLRDAAAVHFTSEMEAAEAAALGLELRGTVIPLAAEPGPPADRAALLARHPELAQAPWLLFLSRLDRKKNVELLLRALASAPAGFPRCLIAGDGEPAYVAELHALAHELGIAARVTWAGHLEGSLKSAALAGASVFVLPSASENFGISVVEALQAGVPVVAARGVAIAASVQARGAGLCIDADPDAILVALSQLLGDERLRESCAANARRLAAEEYSLEALGSKLQSLYETILASPEHRLSHAS